MPGPGNYDDSNIRGFGAEKKGFKMGGKAKEMLDDGKPGPGQYEYYQGESMTKTSQANVKFGSSKRE